MSTTFTPKFHLPQQSSSATDSPSMALFNAAMLAIETAAAKDSQGAGLGSRPPAGQAGVFYTDTTTNITYRDNGTSWQQVGGTGNDLTLKNSVVGSIPLQVQGISGTTANLQTWSVAGSTYPQDFIDKNGKLQVIEVTNKSKVTIGDVSKPVYAESSSNNSGDKVGVLNALTGFVGPNIQEWQVNGTAVASLDKTGKLVLSAGITANGASTITGTVGITGTTTITGDLNVSGNVTALNLTPATDPTWQPITSFAAGVSHPGFGWAPQYRIWPDGKVELRGLLATTSYPSGTFPGSGTSLCSLPTTAAPAQETYAAVPHNYFTAGAASTASDVRIQIDPGTAQIFLYCPASAITFIALDGVTYYTT